MFFTDERKESSRLKAVLALTAAGILGITPLAMAEGARTPARIPVNANGMRVYIDAASGKIKQPTEAEKQALEKGVAALFNNLQTKTTSTQFADGTVSLSLGGQFLNVAIVTTNANGSLSEACVNSLSEANAALAGAPALEEK
jgi:hypothetical protein